MKFTATVTILICSLYSSESIFLSPWRLVSFFKPKVLNFVDFAINGTACGTDLRRFINDLFEQKLWAAKMFDASSKLNSGLLEGNMRLYGNYDQCLSVQNNIGGNSVSGQYCTVFVIPTEYLAKLIYSITARSKNMDVRVDSGTFTRHKTYHYGLCIPKSCTVTNLNNLWSNITKVVNIPVQAKFLEEACHYKNKPATSSTIDNYVFLFFSFMLILVLVSTGYDVYLQNLGQEPNIFVSFSLYTNTKKLFSTHLQNKSLSCLYGIKAITMIWVIFGQLVVSKMYFSMNSMYAIFEWPTRLENSVFTASTYAVDTFYSISGLLVIYVGLSHSKESVHFLAMYLHRVLRLVPALTACILFNISVVKYLLKGPSSFEALENLKSKCDKNWWATLLFINNFVNLEQRCLPESWYLSSDTQLYLLSPFLIYYLKKNPRRSLLGIVVVCTISFIYTWTTVVEKKIGFMIYREVPDRVAGYTYFSTFSRMPAWFIGTYFGYLIYQRTFKKIEYSKFINFILWALSLSTMTSLVLSHVLFFKQDYNIYRSAFFNTFSRPLWSLSVCYVIFSCCTGHGGVVNKFLSHSVLIVLGKLTYGIYLTHLTVLYVVGTNRKQAGYFTTFEILFEFCGYFVLILISSTVLCLIFETPIVSFLNHLAAHKSKREIQIKMK